jgi:hypothetical protein
MGIVRLTFCCMFTSTNKQTTIMKRTIILTQIIHETIIVKVELTDKELASMSKHEIAAIANDLATDRDMTQTIQEWKVDVKDGNCRIIL